jgi:hypothetical protein
MSVKYAATTQARTRRNIVPSRPCQPKLAPVWRGGFLFSPSGTDGEPHLWVREGTDSGVNEHVFTEGKVAGSVRAGGYTVEVAIPWFSLGYSFEPRDGTEIGMTLLATDNDGPSNWRQIMWIGNGDDRAGWADLTFANKIKK